MATATRTPSASVVSNAANSTAITSLASTTSATIATTTPDGTYYEGVMPVPAGSTVQWPYIGHGGLFPVVGPLSGISEDFTAIMNISALPTETSVTIRTALPTTNTVPGSPGLIYPAFRTGIVTWWFQGGTVSSVFPPINFTSFPTVANAAQTSFRAGNDNDNSGNRTATQSASDGSQSKASYSAGTLAGVVVGCVLGAILLTAAVFLFCVRKRKKNRQHQLLGGSEKRSPLLSGHGEAVYLSNIGSQQWEKHLPQADSDATIRAMTSRTLDQIAMHVENFYTTKNNVVLSTEHQFELETIDCSPLQESISTMLLRSKRPEQLIKHYISSYILSMISFEEGASNGGFLPKIFRRTWQPPTQDTSAITQAYSKWRVLTAYLRQQSGDDQAYIAERDAIVDTAAQHVCKAFEAWARTDAELRFQNLVGIMKCASELGIQLFSQPAKFEWQWQAPRKNGAGGRAASLKEVVILPGLYKTTDEHATPLADPLHLVEPVIVPVKNL